MQPILQGEWHDNNRVIVVFLRASWTITAEVSCEVLLSNSFRLTEQIAADVTDQNELSLRGPSVVSRDGQLLASLDISTRPEPREVSKGGSCNVWRARVVEHRSNRVHSSSSEVAVMIFIGCGLRPHVYVGPSLFPTSSGKV